MGSVPWWSKSLETVISICLLAVLIIIGAGIFIKQFNYNMSRYGIDTAAAIQKLETRNSKSKIPSRFGSLAPAGFEMLSKVEVYNPENLYEKIDGKAPLYTESGFEELSTQRFVSINDRSLWMELYVYDMGNVKNAFSVYSVQRRADIVISRDLDPWYAYRTSNALYCVNGHYYIEVVGSVESNELFNAMVEACDNLRENLPVDKITDIAELHLFPGQNIILRSHKLYLANTFGFERLTDTFTAKYQFGNETVTAFLSKRADSRDAEAIAESYRNFLIENGAVIKNTTNKTLVGKVMDFYGTTEIVFTAGPFVAGIHEAENQQTAEKIAEELYKGLNSLNNE